MKMQHGHGLAEWSFQPGHAALALSIDMELRHSMDTQHGDINMQHCNNVIMQQRHTWTCSTATDLQHGHGHAAWTWTYSMDMDMQHSHGHAALTWTCSMDIDMEHGHAE
jgi:hypothetical protein